MHPILLINPNTSQATTQMMVEIARSSLGGRAAIRGLTMEDGVPMIVEEGDLQAAADVVGAVDVGSVRGVIVAAFGDPGAEALRRRLMVPVVGIGEAAMREAAQHGRFGIATTTPALAAAIASKVHQLGLEASFTGTRFTSGDPLRLGQDPEALETALAAAVQSCIETDGAQAVVIGGGPLGRAAEALSRRFAIPVIGPVPAACRAILRALDGH
ncbi:aspartate/glutamate racemase family protein [Cupriavidus numazuensis]|uniref:Hydantoin racemase n=1 Tax=Cupriavidus numazuensis TaxID=221992 RepID=A0ABN7Q930_9BURK|nr:aspartate/glutamate racemase family protein [Cupriavidus numazuensis]CAG2159869.1 Hydantoin racemase [Cupriavidus numazuensis]